MRFLRTWWARILAGAALIVVAGVTGRISFTHIEDLTVALGQPRNLARLWPFGIDGLIVVGSVVLLQASPDHPRLGWLGVAPGVLWSVFANVESGLRYGWLAATWAGTPAASFALSVFMLERWLKSQVTAARQAVVAGSASTEAETPSATPGPGSAGHPEPPEPLTPEAALRALIGTGSRREIAELLNVPKSRVDRWWASVNQPGDGGTEVVQGGPEDDPEMAGSLNGSGPGDAHGGTE